MTRHTYGFAILLLLTAMATAKEYRIADVHITALVKEDATIEYTERRTYVFDGSYSWANYTLNKVGFSRLTDVSISEAESTYVHENTEVPGTFMVTTNDQEINIKWFYSAEDTARTFTVHYTLHGALAVGSQWTEWFWNLVSDRWKRPTEHVRAKVSLPENFTADSVHAWLRTSVSNARIIKSRKSIVVTADSIARNQEILARILFPTGLLHAPEITSPTLTLDAATSEEAAFQHQQKQFARTRSAQRRWGIFITWVVIISSIITWYIIHRRYGRNYSAAGISKFQYSPPSKEKPAIIGWLMQGMAVNGSHLIATLFDLARQGYLQLSEEEVEGSFLKRSTSKFQITIPEEATDTTGLTEWEQTTVRFIRERLADGKVYLDELTDQRSAASKWFTSWAKLVTNAAKSRGWRDDHSVKMALVNGGLQLFYAGAGILAILLAGVTGILALGCSVIFMLLSFAIIRRTKRGESVYRQWKTFKQGIKSGDRRQFNLSHVDQVFIYGIALGISGKILEDVLRYAGVHPSHVPWVVFFAANASSPSAIAESMNTLASTGLQSVSSVAGGAGATAGSAGGGAGGGAG